MASSVIPEKAQTLAKCQFCKETKIKLKCMECKANLCQSCSDRIHLLIDNLGQHKIIDIDDTGSVESAEKHRRFDIDNMKCSKHKGKKYLMFCNDCRQSLCVLCNKESHMSHNTDDLWDSYDEFLKKISNFKETIDGHFSFFTSHEQHVLTSQTLYNVAKELIVKNDKEMKKAIEEYTATLLEKLESMFQPIRAELNKVQANLVNISERKKSVGKVLSSQSAEDVLVYGSSLDTKLPEKTTNGFHPVEIKYILCKLSLKACGDVYISKVSLIKTYRTAFAITNLLYYKDSSFIIGDYRSGEIQRVTFENEVINVIASEFIQLRDMTMTENGEIIISTGNNGLMRYTTERRAIKTFKSIPSFLSLGIHFNERKELLVGLTESREIDIKSGSIRKVVVLDRSGEIIHTFEYDQDGKRLFTWPWRIVTVNDIICVIDTQRINSVSDLIFDGRVVAIDYRGNKRWTYNGEGLIRGDGFWPQDIIITTTGMILVSDRQNNAIHILDHVGQAIVCHRLQDLRVTFSAGMDIDLEGNLWVGEWHLSERNIHRLELNLK